MKYLILISLFCCFSVVAKNKHIDFVEAVKSPNPYEEQQEKENQTSEEYVLTNAKSDRYQYCLSAAIYHETFMLLAVALEAFDSKDEIFSSLASNAEIDYPFLTVRGDATNYVMQQTIIDAWDNRHTEEKDINLSTHPTQVFWNECLSFSLDIFEQTWRDVIAECNDDCDK